VTGRSERLSRSLSVVVTACEQVGLDPAKIEPIRFGENALYRLDGQQVVVRVARRAPAALATATKEVRVSQWLATHQVSAVRALEGAQQPVEAEGRIVTFWHELPPHRYGSYPEIAQSLRRLHALPVPTDFRLEPLAPFTQLDERVTAATTLSRDDRDWLQDKLATLGQRYNHALPPGLPHSVVHGDASAGNVVATTDGQVFLLDLERISIGPPEWDLVATAIDHTTFGILSEEGYKEFCQHYGADVMEWEGFELLRDVRELRISCWMAQLATENPQAQADAELRVACLRGKHGPRPWPWRPVF
jgi:aminoglycoside phosphotransferase (APT) family kinase protein